MKEIRESASNYDTEGESGQSLRHMPGVEGIMAVLGRLHSAREYSATRTSPVFNRLTQVWVAAVSGSNLVDINRVHRNLYFDISSSDPAEDYLQFEAGEKIKDIPQASISMIPREVLSFCTQERILNYFWVVAEIVKKSFHRIDNIETEIEEDPETGEKWVLVSIMVRGVVEEILEEYDHYTEGLISNVPWPERDKIRLSFNII